MIKFALALAPVVLLAACGSGTDENTAAAPDPTGLASNEPDPAELPAPSADGVDTIDYSGSYTFTGLDGSESTLTLDSEAGTYEYVSPGGTTTGTYERLDAGRIAIEDFGGRPAYFSIAPGALYRLAEETSPFDEIDPGRLYRRTEGAMPSVGADNAQAPVASGSTNSVADKRDR